jgi:hypothetical protein
LRRTPDNSYRVRSPLRRTEMRTRAMPSEHFLPFASTTGLVGQTAINTRRIRGDLGHLVIPTEVDDPEVVKHHAEPDLL